MTSTPVEIEAAAAALQAGGLVIAPTETVYGLACNAADPRAVARVFEAKGRPHFNPLIAHVLGVEEALAEADLPGPALELAARFWPGPLSLVAPRKPNGRVCDLACAGLASVALRAPAHPVMRDLLVAFGGPIAAPSANRSGRLSPTTLAHAHSELGARVNAMLDGGPCALGLESTIVGFDARGQARLLRPGALARHAIEALIGPLAAPGHGHEAPGMLASHYAPASQLRLNVETPDEGEAYLGFGDRHGALNLSPAGDLAEAAANLFAMLRALDAQAPTRIAVAPIPVHGLGEAINDRLVRAAAPRD